MHATNLGSNISDWLSLSHLPSFGVSVWQSKGRKKNQFLIQIFNFP